MMAYCAVHRQLVTNYRTGKADQALSVWFLMQWVLGDLTNLLGAVFTDQLFTQVYILIKQYVTMTPTTDCYSSVLSGD